MGEPHEILNRQRLAARSRVDAGTLELIFAGECLERVPQRLASLPERGSDDLCEQAIICKPRTLVVQRCEARDGRIDLRRGTKGAWRNHEQPLDPEPDLERDRQSTVFGRRWDRDHAVDNLAL